MDSSSKDQVIFNLDKFLAFARKNPPAFLDQYPVLVETYQSEDCKRGLILCRIASLFSMSSFAEAKLLALDWIPLALQAKDYHILVHYYLYLAKCLHRLQESHQIKACFDFAIEYARISTNREDLIDAYVDFCSYLLSQQRVLEAKEMIMQALHLVNHSPNISLQITVLKEHSNVLYAMEQYNKASVELSKAYELSLPLDDIAMQIRLLDMLSTLQSLQKQYHKAGEYLQRALQLCEQYSCPRYKILFNLGTIYLNQLDYTSALPYFLESQKNAEEVKFINRRFQCDLNSNLAGCYLGINDHPSTLRHINLAIQIAEQINDPNLLFQTKFNQSNLLMAMKQYEQARKIIEEASKYYKHTKQYEKLLHTQKAMIKLQESQGNSKAALKAWGKMEATYIAIIDRIKKEQGEITNQGIQAVHHHHDNLKKLQQSLCKTVESNNECSFIGCSPAHKKVLESALLAAQHHNANVLISGESGTGKDVLANIIHFNSLRKDAPFVAINAAAISPSLMESELFGHKKGAYTGAVSDGLGFFRKAHRGTLFLDEVTEIPTDIQSKLLRVSETGKLIPVGSTEEVAFDCRIVAATNKDIRQAIKFDRFRLDLFHRLNIIEIHIPPLRERRDDIALLVEYYAEHFARLYNKPIPVISQEFFQRIMKYSFPGNVRELKNIIERLFILSSSHIWNACILEQMPCFETDKKALPLTDNDESRIIVEALNHCSGKQKDAARILGISESTLTRRIEKYHLKAYTNRKA